MTIPPDKSPDRISPGKASEPIEKPATPKSPASFEEYMQGTAGKGTPTPGTAAGAPMQGPTPMEVAKGAVPAPTPTYDTILAQAKNMKDSLGTVEKQLSDPKLQLKRSQSHLVRQKLTDANGYMRAAGSMVDAKMVDEQVPSGLTGISRFLAMLNSGQDQLYEVQEKLSELSKKGEQMNAGEMMAIQVKMGLAQQEIEYTSTLLSKVIQSLTQIINTQL